MPILIKTFLLFHLYFDIISAIGGFGLSIFDKAFIISLILLLPFLFLSFGIVLAYLKLNKLEILIKDLRNE